MTLATLSDGKTSYSFLLDPEEILWSYQASYSNNSVLLTSAPDIQWQSSVTTFSCPIKFLSQGMVQDMSTKIKPLADWCLSGATLRFSYGSTAIPRCHIIRFSITEKQWRNGKTSQADATIEFLVSRGATGSTGQTQVTRKITPREQLRIKQKVLQLLKNPAFRRKYGLGNTRYNIEVLPDGSIVLKSPRGQIKKLPKGVVK